MHSKIMRQNKFCFLDPIVTLWLALFSPEISFACNILIFPEKMAGRTNSNPSNKFV